MTRPVSITLGVLSLILPALAAGGPRDEIVARYAAEAQRAGSGFSAFSAERGQILHTQKFGGAKPIGPVAVSAAPARYTDFAKVEKWFKRNCNEVLGRECTATAKGDWLTYMMKQ